MGILSKEKRDKKKTLENFFYSVNTSQSSGATRDLSFFKEKKSHLYVTHKQVYGASFSSLFDYMKAIDYTKTNSPLKHLTVIVPITHSIDKQQGKELGCLLSIPENTQLCSFLKFKFTCEGEKLFLNFKCAALSDMYDYDLQDLLELFTQLSEDKLPENSLRIKDQRYCLDDFPQVHVREVTIDANDESSKPLIERVKEYHRNCLKRFQELTYKREKESFRLAKEMGDILEDIANDYKLVTSEQYKRALACLDILEKNSTYHNDPNIVLSLNNIRESLELLWNQALLNKRGISISVAELELFWDELLKHEGMKPDHGFWFPVGTVDALSERLKTCFDIQTTDSLAPQLC